MSKKPSTIVAAANAFLEDGNNREKKEAFIDKFSECEVYCRSILVPYYKENYPEIKEDQIGLDRKEIKVAFEERGITFDDAKLLTRLFGADDKAGSRSCRILRNKILHEMMLSSIREVCTRSDELMSDMNSFIEQVEAN